MTQTNNLFYCEMTGLNNTANIFFYKLYNYGIEDTTVIDKIPAVLYSYVTRELSFYKNNTEYMHMDHVQFHSFIYNLIKLKFTKQHEQLITSLQ